MESKLSVVGVSRRLAGWGLAALPVLLATALPALADVAPIGGNSTIKGPCGAIGGAALSALLVVAGCWMVRATRRSRG